MGVLLARKRKADLAMKDRAGERGVVILWLFIAVALFGALLYTFTRSTRTSTTWLEKESAKAGVTGDKDCDNALALATKRLELRGCGALISYEPDGSILTMTDQQTVLAQYIIRTAEVWQTARDLLSRSRCQLIPVMPQTTPSQASFVTMAPTTSGQQEASTSSWLEPMSPEPIGSRPPTPRQRVIAIQARATMPQIF